jgi:hypothetical protein
MNKPSMCDVCGERPGTALLLSSAGDTWACDECQGIEAEECQMCVEAETNELCAACGPSEEWRATRSWQEELEEQTYQMSHSFNEPR